MSGEFHFIRPWCLLALLPAALLLFWLARRRYRQGDWAKVCDAELLPYILQDIPGKSGGGNGMLAAGLAALTAILALAGPTWQRLPSPAFRNDSALVIALDLSKSMDAADIKPSRIGRARYKISDILRQRKDGQTALLVYSGDAFTVTPLTTDTATVNSQLEALATDIMPSPGSNTQAALQKSAELLRQAGLAQGHILLVTDGAEAGLAEPVQDIVGGYRLSVLALGTPEGAPIPQVGGGFLKNAAGDIVLAQTDTAVLTALASAGGGLFQAVTADDADVERLGSLFNRPLEAGEGAQADRLLQQWDEKGPWLLLPLLLWAALRFRKGLLVWGFVLLLPQPKPAMAFDWQSLWQTPDQQAQRAFDRQEYPQAAERFENPEWRAAAQYKAGQYQAAAETLQNSQSADGQYNLGNALAKAGQLPQALQAYQRALQLDPGHADAEYNKAQVEKALQQQNQNQDNGGGGQGSDEQGGQDKPQAGENGQTDKHPPPQASGEPGQQQDQAGGSEDKPKPPQQEAADQSENGQNEQPAQKPAEKTGRLPSAAEREESARANEQLLKRIPDQPTGLLLRKFKYQYGQRKPPAYQGPDW